MPYSVRYTRAAAAEVQIAVSSYARPEVNQAAAFVGDLERTESRLRTQPVLYQRIEGEIRRAVLRRFPYALFYVVESERVVVLALMHQHQKPKTREDLLKR